MEARVLIAGDFRPVGPVQDYFNAGLYDEIFSEVREITGNVDYSVVNMESPILYDEIKAKPIKKIGPALKCLPNAVDALKYAGFKCVTLANNHFYDYGENGVKCTINELIKKDLDYMGGGCCLEDAEKILYKSINNIQIAFLNFCENEFSIATKNHGGAAPLNLTVNFKNIQKARKHADYVVVIVHGGIEMYQFPTIRMRDTYRFFIDAGADAVINHHQHCLSGMEVYRNKPIFYGLGNFCYFNNSVNQLWENGIIVVLQFDERNISYSYYPYRQYSNDSVKWSLLQDRSAFDEMFKKLSAQIEEDEALDDSLYRFVKGLDKKYLCVLEPYCNKFLRYLYFKGVLPSMLTSRQKYLVTNYIRNESHREIILKILDN